MPKKKKKKIDADEQGDRWFGENSTVRDNADGTVNCVEAVLDGLVEKEDRNLIAKILEFMLVNYYEYIGMPEEEAVAMKVHNPYVGLIRPPWQEPRNEGKSIKNYNLIDQGHTIRNMVDVIIADVINIGKHVGEHEAEEIFKKVAGIIYQPYKIAKDHRDQDIDKKEEVAKLDELWDMSNENNS